MALDIEHIEGASDSTRGETITYMREHFVYKNAQFQSGLSMLDRMYDDHDHGVMPDPDVDDEDREALSELVELVQEITEDVEIRSNTIAFVPQRESDAGALTSQKECLDTTQSPETMLDRLEKGDRRTPGW